MRKTFAILALVALAGGAFAQFADATNIWTGTLGVKENRGASDDVVAYDDTVNFTGFGFAWGAAGPAGAVNSTWMDADNLTVLGSEAGKGVLSFTFSSVNFNALAVNASPTVAFWTDNGGVPGTAIAGFRFNPLNLGAGAVNLWTYSSATALFNIPASGKLFMGVSWDDFSDVAATGITVAQLGELGQGIFDAPVVGSSPFDFWSSDNFGSNYVNNPVGAMYDFGANPNANFGNKLTTADPVPEPVSLAAIGLGLIGLISRRRKN